MYIVTLVALVLLGSGAAGAEQFILPDCEPGVRHIELTAGLPAKAHEICVRSGKATTVLSDSKLAWVTLTEGHRVSLHWGEDGFTVVPSPEVYDGERIPLTVRFQDGAAPASVTFILIVHPSQAERQVEVSRRPRTLATYQQEAKQARVAVRQCREEQARLRSERGGLCGLGRLLATGLSRRQGIPAKNVSWVVPDASRTALIPHWVTSYRFDTSRESGREPQVQVAVEIELENHMPQSWTAAGAALMRNGEEVKRLNVLQSAAVDPGGLGALVVETTLTEEETRGFFTLKLWDAEGRHGVTIDGVTFP